MTKALQWWWRWNGPESPIGPLAGVLWAVQLILAFAIIAPPVIWALRVTIGPWWTFWTQ